MNSWTPPARTFSGARCLAGTLLLWAGAAWGGAGGNPVPPPSPQPAPLPTTAAAKDTAVPPWALAALRIKELGKSFDRLAAWSDSIVANTGSLVRQSSASFLFPVPIEKGLDRSGPAAIFLLGPVVKGQPLRTALVLPVTDAEVLKKELDATFGFEEKEGLLKLSIPQGFNEPDKELRIRVGPKTAWVAPDERTLKKLETWTGQKGAQAGVAVDGLKNTPDAAVTISLDALRKSYQKEIEQTLAWLAVLGLAWRPSSAVEIQALKRAVLEKTRELGRLDLTLDFQRRELVVSGRLKALAHSALARFWERKAPKMGRARPRLLPLDSAFYLQVPSENLAWLAFQILNGTKRFFSAPPDTLAQTILDEQKAVAALHTLSNGETAFAARPLKDGGAQVFAVIGGRDPKKLEAAWERFLKKAALLAAASYRHATKPRSGQAPALALQALPESKHGGVKVRGYTLRFAEGQLVPAALRKALERLLGWPVRLYFAPYKKGLIVVAGRQAKTGLRSALERARGKGKGGLSLADAPDWPRAFGALGEGTDAWALLRPVGWWRLWSAASNQTPEALKRLTRNLQDAPIRLRLETGAGLGTLRLRVPSPAVQAIAEIYLRLHRMSIGP